MWLRAGSSQPHVQSCLGPNGRFVLARRSSRCTCGFWSAEQVRGAVSDLVKDDEMQMVLSGNKDWGRKFRSLSLSTFASCFSYYPVPIAGWRRSKRSQVQSSTQTMWSCLRRTSSAHATLSVIVAKPCGTSSKMLPRSNLRPQQEDSRWYIFRPRLYTK